MAATYLANEIIIETNTIKMANLATTYLNLSLKNPLIVSSSGLTDSAEKIEKLAEAGAGAVVLKSLFEEQINHEAGHLSSFENSNYPEAQDYISNYAKSNSLDHYLNLIEQAKKAVEIPVIASINCVSAKEWISFAKQIESAGADALELNLFFVPNELDTKPSVYEELYLNLIRSVNEQVNIPVSVKIGYQFTNLPYLVNQMYYTGAKGVVLFNKFYEPDIDLEKMKFKSSEVFSKPSDLSRPLRWTGIVSSLVNEIDIAASTGVHSGEAMAKMILAGATAVQLSSAIYKDGPSVIGDFLSVLNEFMNKKNYKTIEDFKGLMNYRRIDDPAIYERSQFMKYFSNLS